MKIILASSSPFRKALLARLQIPFECVSPHIDESIKPGESHKNLCNRLSAEKAIAVAKKNPNALCIGSDEIATLREQILYKPGNHQNAVTHLRTMQNQWVTFLTSTSIFSPKTQTTRTIMIPTKVHFKPLTDDMIENYLRKIKPYQCAASFQSETLGITLIDKFESTDPSAIMGLPLITLTQMLIDAGIKVL